MGIASGFGELLGYGLRLVSGRLADKTRQFWPITIVGYVVQMTAVPPLDLARSWPTAAGLLVVERIGKATRNPPRNVMLSHAGSKWEVTAGHSAFTRLSTSSARSSARSPWRESSSCATTIVWRLPLWRFPPG